MDAASVTGMVFTGIPKLVHESVVIAVRHSRGLPKKK
jgi:hypothetical protein